MESEARVIVLEALWRKGSSSANRRTEWESAVVLLFGLTGRPPAGAAEVADLMGVQRGRVGEVQRKVRSRLAVRSPVDPAATPPALRQALDMVAESLPCTVDDLDARFQRAGLTDLSWSAPALSVLAVVGRVG